MTSSEWNNVNKQYFALLDKEHRSELEEYQYQYLDKIVTYVHLVGLANETGNKNPSGNFLIQDAKIRMQEAEKRLREFIYSTKASV